MDWWGPAQLGTNGPLSPHGLSSSQRPARVCFHVWCWQQTDNSGRCPVSGCLSSKLVQGHIRFGLLVKARHRHGASPDLRGWKQVHFAKGGTTETLTEAIWNLPREGPFTQWPLLSWPSEGPLAPPSAGSWRLSRARHDSGAVVFQ